MESSKSKKQVSTSVFKLYRQDILRLLSEAWHQVFNKEISKEEFIMIQDQLLPSLGVMFYLWINSS